MLALAYLTLLLFADVDVTKTAQSTTTRATTTRTTTTSTTTAQSTSTRTTTTQSTSTRTTTRVTTPRSTITTRTTTSTTTTTTSTTRATITTTTTASFGGWVVGTAGRSCVSACEGKQPCNQAGMRQVQTSTRFSTVSKLLAQKTVCNATSPRVKTLGYAPAYNAQSEPCLQNGSLSTCAAVPPSLTDFKRLCCCASNIASCPVA